jgi:hypothetical protein
MRRAYTLVFCLATCAASLAQDSTVIVYRPSKFAGSALKPSIYLDGNQVARLANGRYVSLQVAPGKHNFESSMKHAAPLELEVKSNETVYLEMVLLPGTWRGGGRLVPVGEDDAKSAMLKLKPLDARDVSERQTSASPPVSPESPPNDTRQADSESSTQVATITVKSTPSSADIEVDGKFVGNTPSTIQLAAGEHEIVIEKEGLRPWQRTMTVSAGGNINIDATLEKP